jgi:hypothetical protein
MTNSTRSRHQLGDIDSGPKFLLVLNTRDRILHRSDYFGGLLHNAPFYPLHIDGVILLLTKLSFGFVAVKEIG